jgi:membrane protein YqaA with SNARE-associated domain
VSAIAALLAALLIALVPDSTALVTFGLLTLWCHGPLSPLLPAAYEPVLLGYGRVYQPVLLAVLGASVSTSVEFANYYLYQRLLRVESVDRLLRRQETGRLTAPFYRRPFLTVWLCVLTPLPDWATRVLASHSGYSIRRYLSAVFLARLPRFWLLAALGFQLELGAGVLLWIVAVSAAVTLFGAIRRHLVSVPSKPTLLPPAAVLLSEEHSCSRPETSPA